MDEIKIKMANKVNLFIGHSGVGKSSILNCLDNNIIQRVGEVSEAWNKGKHTTVTSRLFLFDNDTMVIDTPGLKEIEPYGIEITDITHYFKEIAKHSEKCRYNDCTHTHEPDCRVKEAVNSNYISIERYNSYLRLIESIEKDRF